MKYNSTLHGNEVYLHAAALAAHLTNSGGFRQRDLRFYADLCVNWAEDFQKRRNFSLQNNQIKRYLEFLVQESYATLKTKLAPPRYALSRSGLLALLERMRLKAHSSNKQHFLFVIYFLNTYRETFEKLLATPGKPYPPTLKMELLDLVDVSSLLDEELKLVEQEIEVMRTRIYNAEGTSTLVKRLTKQQAIEKDIISQVEQKYPYELNSQKTLSELVGSLPAESRLWELEYGTLARVRCLWGPTLELVQGYKQQLLKLKSSI